VKISDGKSGVKWDPLLVACLDASFAKISWDVFQDNIKSTAWTLAHGDFHPANMMWDNAASRLVLLDWEVVGLGSGPQDLAQFLISHMDKSVPPFLLHWVYLFWFFFFFF
jgi:thiamine kinase-like enzyme